MEPTELFGYLESNQPHIVEDAKKKLHQIFNKTKESWLLNGLFDYYLSSNSARAVEILVGVREPHDKYLFDRLCELLKNPVTKVQALTVLGHVLRREPAWLYKITQHQLLKDLLKLLKTEMEILPLLSALLVIVVLLPIVPALIGPHLQDIFDIFSRLAAWNCNPGKLAEEQLVHLQVAMYALFLRLYGMYPCNFLAYLRNHYRQGDNMPVFVHTVKPMLGTVKIHPHLVTASKDNEMDSVRWKRMGHHDVIVECEKFAVDMSGGGTRDESCYLGLTSSFRSRSGTTVTATTNHPSVDAVLQQSFRYPVTGDKDFWSPSLYFHSQHSSSPPPPQLQQQVPEVCAPTSVPHTPNSQIPNTQNFVSGPLFPQQEGTSPPEAAIEATPETTPIKDPRSMSSGRPLPAAGSNVARALTNLNSGKWAGLAVSGGSTPTHSQPSSPMRKEPSPFRFPNENSAFEPSARRDTAVSQKLFRIMQDRSQANENHRARVTAPSTSPLRMAPARHTDSVGGQAPDSPVPLVDGPNTAAAKSEWATVARPRPERNGLPSPGLPAAAAGGPDATQEDQEVVEIVRQGEMNAGATRPQLCDSVLQEDGDFEAGETQEDLQHQGSPCTSGGLHMPNSHSLQVFATRVHRLRYYSQCGPTHDHSFASDASSTGSSPGQGPSTAINPKVRRANSCPEMKKNYGGPLQHAPESLGKALDESDELNMDFTSQPQQKHMSNGTTEWDKPPQRSTSTQTLDLWPMPYEHLFVDVLPLLEMNMEARASPSPSPAPHQPIVGVRFSPYEMLDKYIEQAAQGAAGSCQGRLEAEVRHLREQLGLVHLQLQYERHRREVHAVRNRRLLGESRNNRALEEHNSALRDQVALLQKEIEHLNYELKAKKRESDYREHELHEVVSYWHGQCLGAQDENTALKAAREQLCRELEGRAARELEIRADCERASAELFQLGAEMAVALEQAAQCDRLRTQLERTQRELMLAGELIERYRERLVQWPLMEHRHEEARLAADAYHDEIRYLMQQLDARHAVVESQRIHLQELENANQQRDELCAVQKRMLKQVKDEYHEQLCAVEAKYETQRAVNRAMEGRMLELWQRIETLEAAAAAARVGSRPRAPHSPDTSSCHEAGADRTSATAGGLSPHSSPLSASLASSEGSVAFLQHQDVREIKNLQVIVDQTEGTSRPGASAIASEDNTPDGGHSD